MSYKCWRCGKTAEGDGLPYPMVEQHGNDETVVVRTLCKDCYEIFAGEVNENKDVIEV